MEPVKSDRLKKWRKRAVLAGVVLALVCGSLPPEYREACEAVAAVCKGGF